MAYQPAFLVTEVKKVRRYERPNAYTGGSDARQEYWRVHLVDGADSGFTYDFFYESEAEADRFAPWEVLHPSEVLKAAAVPNEQFIAGEPYNLDVAGQPNFYTGAASRQKTWKVPFTGGLLGLREFEIQLPNQQMALQFRRGSPYSLLDFFGTLRSPPFDVARMLADRAARLRELLDRAGRARKAAREAMLEEMRRRAARSADDALQQRLDKLVDDVGRLSLDPAMQQYYQSVADALRQAQQFMDAGNNAAAEFNLDAAAKVYADALAVQADADAAWAELAARDAQARGDFEQDWSTQQYTSDAARHLAAARQDVLAGLLAEARAEQALADAALAQAQAQLLADLASWAASHAGQPMPAAAKWWTITNGGATGWYDWVFYRATTFFIRDGDWFGVYSRDGKNPAPPGNYSDTVPDGGN